MAMPKRKVIMTTFPKGARTVFLLAVFLLACLCFGTCVFGGADFTTVDDSEEDSTRENTDEYIIAVEDEPNLVDFQRTTIHYTVAQNVFNRLVEMESDTEGKAQILPSLAKSWEISDDRLTYTFHLEKGVTFSNGSPLTSSDVLYTFTRLLTLADSCNEDIVSNIEGASQIKEKKTTKLKGFKVLDDHNFTITLEEPFEAFLACLTMPGASILDEETTTEAGDRFGIDPAWTIGTGPFIMESWERGEGMILRANPDCWQGAPACAGLDLRFVTDPEQIRMMFDSGQLDILNLDDVGKASEFYMHGSVYQDRLYKVPRISITYIALNESIEPLNDVKVRKALQLALNRQVLLDAAYSGYGQVEQGIMPYGLYGYNPDLKGIPYDTQKAKELLKEAGYPDGFSMTISASSASSLVEMSLIRAAVSMWEKVGVHVGIEVIDESKFINLRRSGDLTCYCASWTADYNDPDNFLYTFFGDVHNTTFRSLCYPKEDIMKRVADARKIADPDERIAEYRDLEEIIAQDDAAWIPLFSRSYFYVISKRLRGFAYSWNGSVKNKYREMSVQKDSE